MKMWWFQCSEPFGVGFSWLTPILVAFVRTQDLIEVRSAASSTGTKASGGVSRNPAGFGNTNFCDVVVKP